MRGSTLVAERSFKLISDAEEALQSAIAKAKPFSAGMTDGSSWAAKLEPNATWEKLVEHASSTILKADNTMLQQLKLAVVQAS